MEDFAPILWILLFVGISAYSAISQTRKQTGKTGGKPHTQEAWPSWDPVSAPAKPTHPHETDFNTPESQYAELSEAPRPGFGQAISGVADYMSDQMQAQESIPLTTTRSSLTSEAQAIGSTETHENNLAAEISDNFDLRRAVVYSEILKPKFDEYER